MQNKVISTKVSVDLHNKFNLLAEYLFESFTPSALLRYMKESMLDEYHDGLEAHENYSQLINNSPRTRIT
jgi:hypothetical protein